MSKQRIFVALALAGSIAALAPSALADAPPPELKKTVDAFVGKWVYDATVSAPGGKPEKTKLYVDCRKTALGKGVSCVWTGSLPGEGAFEGTAVVGYDTFGKQVHFMGVFSDEEVHDHRCSWRANALECEPLKAGMGGMGITEELSFTFDGKMGGFKSIITLPDGGKVVFDATGKRK